MNIPDTKHVIALLARPLVEGGELWSWDVWRPIAAGLSPWIARPTDVETRSHQTLRDARQPVVFPKLGWSDEDAQAWTHRSPVTAGTSANWNFGSTHVFAPAWSVCAKADLSPSIYVEVKNRRVGGAEIEVLLVSLRLDVAGGEQVPVTLRALLAALMPPSGEGVLAFTVRPFMQRRRTAWVRGIDAVTHTDLDQELSLDAMNRESAAMDKRNRLVSDSWHPLRT
jgi:hypothetical protein